jgi:hypothetical protein
MIRITDPFRKVREKRVGYSAFVSSLACHKFGGMLIMFGLGKERLLSGVPSISTPLSRTFNVAIDSKPEADKYHQQELQCLSHGRFLSTWMPRISKAIATSKTRQSVNQLASLFSKITYRGANTSTKVPASLSDSPIISSVYFFSLNRLLRGEVERTGNCDTLDCFGQFRTPPTL